MLSALFTADADTFDIFMLLALILFAVAGVMSFMQKAVVTGLAYTGLASMALAFLFLV